MSDKEGGYDPEELERRYREAMEAEFSRDRGFLTGTDRKYLWGQTEYKHPQTESDRRRKIRDRSVNGLRDLAYLLTLGKQDRRRIVDVLDEVFGGNGLRRAVRPLIEFVYVATGKDESTVARLIERGILAAEEGEEGLAGGGTTNVSVTIDVDRGLDVSDIYERYQAGGGDDLNPAEIGLLVRSGLLDAADLDELAVDRIEYEREVRRLGRIFADSER